MNRKYAILSVIFAFSSIILFAQTKRSDNPALLYSTEKNVKVTIDGSESSPIALSGQNAWNIILAGIDASDRVEFYLPGS